MNTHEYIIEEQIKMAKLWLEVCDEQDRNNYDWELTKSKLLSDWNADFMTVDFWTSYMNALFAEYAIQHYLIDEEKAR